MARAPRYDTALKAEVVALAVQIGPAEAARQHGIKATTVRSWCSRGGVATVAATESTKAATEARKATTEERKARLADRLLELAEMSTEAANELVKDASLRDLIGALDYAIKNSQLLSGAQTARFGTDTQREAVVKDARDRALRLVG